MMERPGPQDKGPTTSVYGNDSSSSSPKEPIAVDLVNCLLEKRIDIWEPGSKLSLFIRDPRHHHRPLLA